MSCNKFRPHLLVLVEDDANRQIAVGFAIHHALDTRAIQVLPPGGGWTKVVDGFRDNQVSDMAKYTERRILLVVDFDNEFGQRIDEIRRAIPNRLNERVFILGTRSTPENLRNETGASFEEIGQELAEDCADNTRKTWNLAGLAHNAAELDRLFLSVRPFLFVC